MHQQRRAFRNYCSFAFSRWHVERCLSRSKTEHRPGCLGRPKVPRTQTAHDPVECQLHVPDDDARKDLGGKKSGFTVYQVHDAVSALVQSWWLNARASTAFVGTYCGEDKLPSTTKRHRDPLPRQAKHAKNSDKSASEYPKSRNAFGTQPSAVVLARFTR